MREDFLKFVDPHAEAYGSGRDGNESVTEGLSDDKMMTEGESSTSVRENELTLTGTVLGNLVLEQMNQLGLDKNQCVGIGTDGCSVMVSNVCGAVCTIQKVVPQAMRCLCFNHARNLSLAKSSSVQSVRNAVGTIVASSVLRSQNESVYWNFSR